MLKGHRMTLNEAVAKVLRWCPVCLGTNTRQKWVPGRSVGSGTAVYWKDGYYCTAECLHCSEIRAALEAAVTAEGESA